MKRFKKHLPDNAATDKFLKGLPMLYILVKYAWYACAEQRYAYTEVIDGKPIPMVYQYDDHNGTYPEWCLIPATWVTTGGVYCWSPHKRVIEQIAEHENKRLEAASNVNK